MIDLTRATFRYEPYPIGVATGVFGSAYYERLVASWPNESGFVHMQGSYNKFSLSERNNPDGYAAVIRQSEVWGPFHAHVKSPAFLPPIFGALQRHGVDCPRGDFTVRFEFSSLPADEGGIEPHTDIPSKIVTLILPMVRPGEWDAAWGGGTDVLRPLDPWRPYRDYKEPRKAFEIVDSFAYAPNQCVIFIKTFNSWHSVGPIQGPAGHRRRTLTVNIERK